MAKILIMVRTSTEKQSIDDQHREMLEFCKSEGYAESDMVWIEEQGASAAKVDNTYRAMIDRIKTAIQSDPEIRCFAVWHLNRLVRTEEVWVEIKSFFIERGIQMVCKNPYLRLLAPDGSIDKGMELAVGLLVILAKQDQAERKEKFKRAKSSMSKKGMYLGGNTVKYGYKVEDGFFVEDEDEGQIVKTIFDLYSTGKYSSYSLAKELKERGYSVSVSLVNKVLRSRAYVGDEVSEKGMHYPQIISKELFERCGDIRSKNKIDMKRGQRICIGAKIVKCPECGATCTSNSRHYVCCRHAHHGPCSNGFSLRQDVADDLLWRTAYPLHLQYLMDAEDGKMDEYRKELDVLDMKIASAQEKMQDFTKKKERIVESFLDLMIDRKTRDLRLLKLQDDIRVHQDAISLLEGKRRAILGILEGDRKDTFESFLAALENMDLESKYEVVHRHIESLVATQESFGNRDPRTTRPNAVRINVTSIHGQTFEYMYVPKYYKGSNLYIWSGRDWVPDMVAKVR